MPIDNIRKPNIGGGQLKTGFKLMSQGVSRGAHVQKPSRHGGIASNHPMAAVRKALSPGMGRAPKKGRMY